MLREFDQAFKSHCIEEDFLGNKIEGSGSFAEQSWVKNETAAKDDDERIGVELWAKAAVEGFTLGSGEMKDFMFGPGLFIW